MKYSEIIAANKALTSSLVNGKYSISVLSNVTMQMSKDILEYSLRKEGIPAEVRFGDYDNIIQDSLKFQKSKLVLIFMELSNLIDGLQYKADLMSDDEIVQLITKVKSEIDFIFKNLTNTPLVIFNKFSTLLFNSSFLRENNFDRICNELNEHLASNTPRNVFLIDIDKIIAKVSIENSFYARNYYSSKALYTVDFFKAFSNFIKPIVLSSNGKMKKALIFDCDNTLWKGIIGEDGMEGIKIAGSVYEEVQYLGLALSKKGILLGLCSKNNLEDVDEVLENHRDMIFKDDDISIKKVNWINKASNLESIANILNIGKDSLVFIDDSDFEINLVKEQTPEIKCIQVPKKSYNYPQLIRDEIGVFFNTSNSDEDRKKVLMYRNQVKREQTKNSFNSIDDYLKSLDLQLKIYENDESLIPRMSQMTQKTNQFNLTTKRYTEADISYFISSNNHEVFAFGVADKFGDSGVTGLCIVEKKSEKEGEIDTYLMSCRVIGRNIEFAFFDYVIDSLKKKGIEKINSQFIATIKNGQVRDFYDGLGFDIQTESKDSKNYELNTNNFLQKNITYIKLENGRKN